MLRREVSVVRRQVQITDWAPSEVEVAYCAPHPHADPP